MRKIAIIATLVIVASVGPGMPNAGAQTTHGRDAQATQSSPPPSSTTGRALPEAPVGHRQPRAADVPRQGGSTLGPGDASRATWGLRSCLANRRSSKPLVAVPHALLRGLFYSAVPLLVHSRSRPGQSRGKGGLTDRTDGLGRRRSYSHWSFTLDTTMAVLFTFYMVPVNLLDHLPAQLYF